MAARDEQEIRPEVFHQDTLNTGFHAGPHPQRPIPPDLNDAEKGALEREKRALSHHRAGRPAPGSGRGSGQPMASVPVDPEHPEKGVLYTGPSAEEEMALRTGRSVKEAEEILAAPAKRAEAAHKAAQKAEQKPAAARKADGE